MPINNMSPIEFMKYTETAEKAPVPYTPVLDYKTQLALNTLASKLKYGTVDNTHLTDEGIVFGNLKLANEAGEFVIYRKDASGDFTIELSRLS